MESFDYHKLFVEFERDDFFEFLEEFESFYDLSSLSYSFIILKISSNYPLDNYKRDFLIYLNTGLSKVSFLLSYEF